MTQEEEKTGVEVTEEATAEEPQAVAPEASEEAAIEAPQAPEPEAVKKPKKAKAAAEEAAPAGAPKAKKSAATEEIMAAIKKMTVLELADLIKALETEFGVTAAAPVMAVATGAAPAEAEAPAEEQTEFDVILAEIGANKINVIKAVRELTTLGLKESKDLVESAPAPVKEKVSKEEAAVAKEKLEAAGAKAEVK